MILRFRPSIIVAIFVIVSATALLSTAPRLRPDGALPIQLQRHTAFVREIKGSTATSSNWSGYAATSSKGSITLASGTWIVPTAVDCGTTPSAYSATWVGIDGWISNTVEQIGTESDCVGGTASAPYAWYEFYPHNYFTIGSLPIKPGDSVSASVKYAGGNFTVSLTDGNQTFSIGTKLPQAELKSAECIVEAPYSGGVLPLVDFGVEQFTTCSANGVGLTSATPGLVAITMVNRSELPVATPGSLSNSSFTDVWSSGR